MATLHNDEHEGVVLGIEWMNIVRGVIDWDLWFFNICITHEVYLMWELLGVSDLSFYKHELKETKFQNNFNLILVFYLI